MSSSDRCRPQGFAAIGAFFVFGAVMAAYAGVTLLIPGTFLDVLWRLNPRAHEELSVAGGAAAMPFLVLSPALGLAAAGWLQRKQWGWWLGVSVIGINLAGDISQIIFGERWKGAIGVALAGLLLFYMTRAQ